MKRFWSVFLFAMPWMLSAQFLFKGQVPEEFYGEQVYLSLVEDYRKTSRVYLDQIIQRTRADSLGNFRFSGNQLPNDNRYYRIHVDSCSQGVLNAGHFMGECSATQSLLFIANNRDTLALPLGNYNQAFCEITSTNPISDHLLQIEALKEEMILDLIESQGETARTLNFDKWFARFQDFGQDSNDPLVDLYAYDFLSDRSSETHQHYLKDLSQSSYYDDLRLSLVEKYPEAAFTNQYDKELQADRTLAAESLAEDATFNWGLLLLKLTIVGLAVGAIGYYLVQKKRNPYAAALKQLSPREKLIFDAIKNGKTNKEISAALFISHSTVKTHINNIYKKLGVTSREEIR